MGSEMNVESLKALGSILAQRKTDPVPFRAKGVDFILKKKGALSCALKDLTI
jgi:hypothetical protein